MFDSDEEATAAAVEVYERYLAVNAAINADHGTNAERILDVTTNRYGTELLAEFRSMREAGVHITGSGALVDWRLAEIDELRRHLDLELCLSAGDTRIIDAAGNDGTPDRPDVAPLVVSFTVLDSGQVRLDGSETWSGEQFC